MLPSDFDIEDVIAKTPMSDKIKLLAGLGWWHTHPVPNVGIPSIRMSDGPNGVRGTRFFNGVPASCFPSSTGLGSSFDLDLARKVGEALADECRAKGAHVLLGPTVNTQRSPLGGRGFESFSEDPHLNGLIAAHYIKGLQSKGIAATIKHFVANDQEYQRFSISSDLSERALREIYLKPFQLALKHGDFWALMTAYNRINGTHCSEHKGLLIDILQKEWGYTGLIMSDWIGVYSTVESIQAGLDIEMPGPTAMRGPAVHRALIGEKLWPSDIDARVRKILGLLKRAYASGVPFDAPEGGVDTPELRALLRTAAADAIVLLKNDKKLLPLPKAPRKIAVIGPNAKQAMTSGGGSARLLSTYTVSPLEGITEAAKEFGAEVKFATGALTMRYLPLLDGYMHLPGSESLGALMEFWNETPSDDFLNLNPNLTQSLPTCAWSTPTQSSYAFLVDGVPDDIVNEICWIRFTTDFVPDESGDFKVSLNVAGLANLFVDGQLVIELSDDPAQGESFFGNGTVDKEAVVKDLKAGKSYRFELRLSNQAFMSRASPFTCRGGIRLGAWRDVAVEEGIHEAVALAKESDVTILVVGLNHDWESEGFDRQDMKLPGATNRLVTEILQANPNTVVVQQSGTQVEMPWVDEAPTLLQAFYGGNELGNGLADVIFGKVNPAGKLSLSFYKRLEDAPSHPSFGDKGQEYGKILYNEGIFVAYRGLEIKDIAPMFPFGYGLSYTTFEYSDLSTTAISSEGAFSVSFTVKNTGAVDGREAAQVYIRDVESSLPRPVKELKGFAKVALKPGESKKVKIDLDRDSLSFYDDRKKSWVAEAGVFEVLVGASSSDIRLKATAELKNTLTWSGL
ncbi:glycoside hydrolase family 3 protein [Punctularia strigosozonata HHB-11173 SS5]|uniref:glycoside hydrolase family 3 protein n=1 Tax=Punctularia strigosozonata (strain HHB-11173) TaxID=741275 RepID=UPI00044175E3|nr:glycoside hydrolase family 3 protein [Punctularia strigosozonata HHB-11173 SS5]EIN10508.1 glycoside hydrolase family 3 protein [Punctularia strigosozonata HHB-11173 SS5]